MKSSLIAFATLALVGNAYAYDCKDETEAAPRGATWKVCKQTNRKSETVAKYLLDSEGRLFAILKTSGTKCPVTQGDIEDFTLSQHPNDRAMLYYGKANGRGGEDLWMIARVGSAVEGECPKSAKGELMKDVAEYKNVSSIHTTIVNVARSKGGTLWAYDNDRVVYRDEGVRDFVMNQCFGIKGKSFSSYAFFSIDGTGNVTKVKDDANNFSGAKEESKRYDTLTQFKKDPNLKICQ